MDTQTLDLKPVTAEAKASQAVARFEQRNPPALAQSERNSLYATMERMARDPNVDVEKVKQIAELIVQLDDREAQRQLATEERQAKKDYVLAMAAAKAEIAALNILRNRKNTETRSTYATLDAIGEQVDPILATHGFVPTFDSADSGKPDLERLECELMHIGGHSHVYHLDAPLDRMGPKGTINKTYIHGLGSWSTYLRRYLICMIFDIKIKDQDDDGNAASGKSADIGGTISDEQANEINVLLTRTKSNLGKFLQHLGTAATSVPEIPAAKYDAAVKLLKAKLARMGDEQH